MKRLEYLMTLNQYTFEPFIQDESSFKALLHLKLPHNKIETFRHFDVEDILSEEYELSITHEVSSQTKKHFTKGFYSLLIKNGQILSNQTDLPPYITLEKRAKKSFKTNNAFAYLSELFFKETTVLKIDKSPDKPLMIMNINTKNNHFIPTSLTIEVSKNSTLDMVDVYDFKEQTNSFANVNRFFDVKFGAHINYTKLQQLSKSSSLIVNTFAHLATKSTLDTINLDYGGYKTLNIADIVLTKKNSSIHLNGLIKNKGHAKNGNMASIEHLAEFTSSNQAFKHVLDEHAQAVCDIKSIIQSNAPFSKAFQNSHTILLSDDAKINAQPRLQIYTDELQASHGATTGALDEEQLNYLQLRGISKQEATNILLTAFEETILNKITHPTIRAFVDVYQKGVHHV